MSSSSLSSMHLRTRARCVAAAGSFALAALTGCSNTLRVPSVNHQTVFQDNYQERGAVATFPLDADDAWLPSAFILLKLGEDCVKKVNERMPFVAFKTDVGVCETMRSEAWRANLGRGNLKVLVGVYELVSAYAASGLKLAEMLEPFKDVMSLRSVFNRTPKHVTDVHPGGKMLDDIAPFISDYVYQATISSLGQSPPGAADTQLFVSSKQVPWKRFLEHIKEDNQTPAQTQPQQDKKNSAQDNKTGELVVPAVGVGFCLAIGQRLWANQPMEDELRSAASDFFSKHYGMAIDCNSEASLKEFIAEVKKLHGASMDSVCNVPSYVPVEPTACKEYLKTLIPIGLEAKRAPLVDEYLKFDRQTWTKKADFSKRQMDFYRFLEENSQWVDEVGLLSEAEISDALFLAKQLLVNECFGANFPHAAVRNEVLNHAVEQWVLTDAQVPKTQMPLINDKQTRTHSIPSSASLLKVLVACCHSLRTKHQQPPQDIEGCKPQSLALFAELIDAAERECAERKLWLQRLTKPESDPKANSKVVPKVDSKVDSKLDSKVDSQLAIEVSGISEC